MPLTNTELHYYDHNVLRLVQEKRKEYHEQVDRLIASLTKKLHEHTDLKVKRVKKAGSFAKHTILRKAEGRSVDVDTAFYLSDRDVNAETRDSLNEQIHDFLVSLYPTKEIEDFKLQKKAATVTFVGSGLDVDIVPMIQDTNDPDVGWQFGTDGSKVKTNVPAQLDFVAKRKRTDPNYRTLVRLGKQWKHICEVPGLKGYTIELVMAHLLDRNGTAGTLEERFRGFLLFLARDQLKEVIKFPENGHVIRIPSDPVIILDPVNSGNNVAARITEAERIAIVEKANAAWNAAHFASIENDLEVWKEIFGPRFKVGT
jgi:hypothetical protein